MRILVTGASGFVGGHLVASLRRNGKSVVTLSRGPLSMTKAPLESIEKFAGPADLADIDRASDWPGGIEAVVHLAALNPSRRETATVEALARANVEGTAALARRARREGVRRMVFLSTANVHSPASGLIRESDPLDPVSDYAHSKAAAEAAFWAALSDGATEGCVLRPAPVYGKGGRGNVATLVKLARLPLPLPLEGLGGERSLLAVQDLVSAIESCLTAEGAAGETFLVADEGAMTVADIVRAVRDGKGRSPGLFAPPSPLAAALAKRLSKAGPFGSFRLDTHRLTDRTGWRSSGTTAAHLTDMGGQGCI